MGLLELREQGQLSSWGVRGLLIVVASFIAEHRLCGALASAAVVQGLS